MSFIMLYCTINMIVFRMVYDMYMTFLPASSCQPQQRPDCCRQIICMAPAGNDGKDRNTDGRVWINNNIV